MPDSGDATTRRARRWVTAWSAMGAALATLLTGVALPHGLLLAAGLVMAALAVNLFGPSRRGAP